MTVRLRMNSEGLVREYAFDRASISIGGGPFNDIVFSDCEVGGVHGKLELREDGELVFRARASALPTQVFRGGRLVHQSDGVEEQALHVRPGDILKLGRAPAVELAIISVEPEESQGWLTFPIPAEAAGRFDQESGRLFYAWVAELSQAPSVERFLRVAAHLFHHQVGLVPHQLELAVPLEASPWRSDDHVYEQIAVDLSAELSQPGELSEAVSGQYFRARDPLPLFRALGRDILAQLETLDGVIWMERADESAAGAQLDQVLIPCALGGRLAAVLTVVLGAQNPDQLQRQITGFSASVQSLAAIALSARTSQRALEGVTEENLYWRERQRRHHLYKDLIAESDAVRQVYQELNACAAHDRPVLLRGEAGSGKALAARAMHHLSGRKGAMLVSINCRSLEGDELDFELFGSVESAWTGEVEARKGVFELADGGTVFMEEIDQLSLMLQGKVLRMLREQEVRRIGEAVGRRVNVRLICSTLHDLGKLVELGRFRRDLYLALSKNQLYLPALREREDDILPLARMYLRGFSERYERPCLRLSQQVEEKLLGHHWAGNVRELQLRIEAAVLHCDQEVIELEHFGLS